MWTCALSFEPPRDCLATQLEYDVVCNVPTSETTAFSVSVGPEFFHVVYEHSASARLIACPLLIVSITAELLHRREEMTKLPLAEIRRG